MLGVLACSRALHTCMLCILCAYVLGCLTACMFVVLTYLCGHVFGMLTCFVFLHAHMSYMLDVVKYLSYLRACVLP